MEQHIAAYVQRILGYVDEAPLSILERTPQLLRSIVSNVPEEQLRLRPAEGEWSAVEILAHLADSELVASFRVRKTVSEPGSSIAAYNQRAWSSALNYANQSAEESIRLFTEVREANMRLYKGLTPEQWKFCGIHAERGEENVEQLLTLLAGHDRNHVAQLRRTIERASGNGSERP